MYKSLRDHVYDYIAQRLAAGSLIPNQKLNEKDICDTLLVSRTPVKEALIQLENEGYLERLPRRGFIVKAFTDKTVFEKYQILGALDALAAELAIEKLTEENLQSLAKLIERMDLAIESGSYDEYNALQYSFHNVYINSCGNQQLISLIEKIEKSFIRKFSGRLEGDELIRALKVTNDEHREILTLLKSRSIREIGSYVKFVHWDLKFIEIKG